MSIKNASGLYPEVFKRDSPKGVGRPKGKAQTNFKVDSKKLIAEGMANLLEVFPLGGSPKSKAQPAVIHKKEW